MAQAKSIVRAILVAILATALVEAIRYLFFIPLFGFSPRATVPFLAIILATWFGGLGAGLLATLLNAVLSWQLLGPNTSIFSLTLSQQVRLGTFLCVSTIIAWGIDALRTSQRRAELREQSLEAEVQRRRQAEARFREVAMHAPVGIFETDAQGAGLFANQAWRQITGATIEEALGDGWTRFVHPDDRQLVLAARQNAMRRRNAVTEFRFINPQRGVRWVVTSTNAILDAAGKVTGYVGTVVDLTERKAAEDALRASEARLRSILDNTPAVISLKDLDGHYVLVNRRWEELFGVSQEEIVGLTNEELLGKTQSPHMSRAIADQFREVDRAVLESGEAVESEDPVQYGDVPQFFVTVKFPIRNATGGITGIGGISIDITERRQAVDALAAEQELLNHTIAVQDQQRQLIAYEIHDGLLQYVTGALLQLEALQARARVDWSTDDLDRAATILRRAVNEGRQLINGIRTPVLDGFGVVAALESLIEEEERAHVTVEFAASDEIGRMDSKIEEAVYRICQEALTNIAKHSQAKKVRIELERRDDKLHLEVRDWGVGFVPARRTSGTVHGLRGMQERARIAGGRCTVESAPGQGTTIVVELPYVARTCSLAV